MIILPILGMAFALSQDVAAPTIRSDLPIDVSAGRCETLETEDALRCEGVVRIAQGDVILTAQTMTVYGVQAEGSFTRIEAQGNVRYSNGVSAMSGQDASYDAETTTLIVTGDVVVVQEDQVMTGGRLEYNSTTGATVFTPMNGDRVRGVFYTSEEER